MTDTEIIKWLENHQGYALVSSDNGYWAVVACGIQTCPIGRKSQDYIHYFFHREERLEKIYTQSSRDGN